MVEFSTRILSEASAVFLAEATTCTSIVALDELFLHWAQGLGFKSAAFIRLASAGSTIAPKVLFGQDDPWVEHYAAQKYSRLDPTIPKAFTSRDAFTWRDVENPDGSPEERLFFQEARAAWAKDALVVPIRGPFGEFSVVNLLSDHPILLPPDAVRVLQGVCAVYAALGLNLAQGALGIAPTMSASLTRREKECVHWMCQGKHDGETAIILGISAHTVREYIDKAKLKFAVASRAELVRKALTYGLLAPDGGLLL